MSDDETRRRHRQLRDNWNRITLGMRLSEVEEIMGFRFNLDSENDAGRMVFSQHPADYLPFYLVVDRSTGLVTRKHNIRVLDELE
jgi:hypothetical protein